MNILIFSANWYNRGDEAAIRALIDEVKDLHPDWKIKIHFNQHVKGFPYNDIEVLQPFIRLAGRNKIKYILYELSLHTNGRVPYIGQDASDYNAFIQAVKWADYAVYAPGGPCIGDFYEVRKLMLDIMGLLQRNNVPYSLFAPSVGPFSKDAERVKSSLNNARVICLREEISKKYLDALLPGKNSIVTLDSAFQHPVDVKANKEILSRYKELNEFLQVHDIIIGITITDLKWHRLFKDGKMEPQIKAAFKEFIKYLVSKGYAIIFIPQLFGISNDKDYMASFAIDNCFVVGDDKDTYFQQYIISKLYAVVGMRYHSNIFSAKMGIPFISVAYEQKMKGFMEKAELSEYCIEIKNLNFDTLKITFDKMIDNYDTYRAFLGEKASEFKKESRKTLELISNDMESYSK